LILRVHAPAYGLDVGSCAGLLSDRVTASEPEHHVLFPAENIPIVYAPPSEDCLS